MRDILVKLSGNQGVVFCGFIHCPTFFLWGVWGIDAA